MLMDIVEALATVVPALVLVFLLKLGVNGLLLSIVISNVAPTLYGLYSATNYLKATVDYANLIKTSLVSGVCYFFVYVLSSFVFPGISYPLIFVLALVVFTGSYLILMPVSRAIRRDDIIRLRQSSRGLGFANKILDPILSFENFLVERVDRHMA
jgi:hypothetical protein